MSPRPTAQAFDLRDRLHEAVDVLLDADDRLTGEQAAAADEAFATLVRLARARGKVAR